MNPSISIKKLFKSAFLLSLLAILASFWSFKTYAQATSGSIGVVLEFVEDKKIHRIRAVFQGSPAAKAKIRAGEEIVAVDGNATDKMNFEELGSRIRGAPGSSLRLTLKNPDSPENREVTLTRAAPQSMSPLIVGDQGSTQGTQTPLGTPLGTGNTSSTPGVVSPVSFTEAEKEQIKAVILKLSTQEERERMKNLLLELKEGKIIKPDFFKILKAKFPGK